MTSYAASRTQNLTRAARRRLVLINTLGYLGLLGFWTLGNRLEFPPFYLLAAACALVFAYTFYKVFVGVHPWNVANTSDKEADERQQAVRNRAHTLAYRVVSLVFALALTYWYVVAGIMGTSGRDAVLWLPSTYNEILAVYWTFLLLLVQLPSAIIAWNEPDPLFESVTKRNP